MTHPDESPDYDAELSRRLAGLADDATAYTTSHLQPLPAESVRRLGTQRRHRRVGGVVVATLACVVMAGGVAIGATRLQAEQPLTPAATPSTAAPSPSSPTPSATRSATQSGSPPASSPPSPSQPSRPPASPPSTGAGDLPALDPSLLPVPQELAWLDLGSYRSVSTSQGQGELPADACVQPFDDLNASAIGRRDFQGVFAGKAMDVQATSWVLRFDSVRQTDTALTTLQGWGTACSKAPVTKVAVPRGSAEFYEHTLEPGADADFAMYGLTRVGDVIAIVLLTSVGQDSLWAYDVTDTTGLPLHPLIRSLPLVNARLAGVPGQLPSPIDPVNACPGGGQNGIDVSTSPVKGSAGAGQVSYRITLRNSMKVACTVQGFPGVQFNSDDVKKVGADAARAGATGPTVTLQPGKTTTAIIRLSQAGAYAEACDPTPVNSFAVVLPGMTEASYTYSPDMIACANPKIVQLTVTAFGTE